MNHHKISHTWKLWLGSLLLLAVFGLGSVNCVVGVKSAAENGNGNGDGGSLVDSTGIDNIPDKQVTPETAPEPVSEPVPEPVTEPSPEPTPEPIQEEQPAAPKVVSTTPKDKESVEQPPGQPIQLSIVFDQSMDASSFTQDAIEIKPAVNGKVSAGQGDKTLVFVPDQPLPYSQTFEVTVKTTVRSQKGVALAQPYTFSFSTKLPGTEPSYLGTFSAAGGTQTGSDGTHHTVMGHNAFVGHAGGQGNHTVQNGYIYSFTF